MNEALEAFQRYTEACATIAWLRDNKLLASTETPEQLAYDLAIRYASKGVKAAFEVAKTGGVI